MRTCDFDYNLPEELIAQVPCANRTDSRLLALSKDTNQIDHHTFKDLPNVLNENDLLVFNNTRVIPARMYGEKLTGGKVEILVERVLSSERCLAQIKVSKSIKIGASFFVLDKNSDARYEFILDERQDDFFIIRARNDDMMTVLESSGHMPLPPYIKRDDNQLDVSRYQTVYAEKSGAVAAPTAGLHFDNELLNKLKKMGVGFAYVTLHVGAGTFQPVRVDNIEDHHMHQEYIEVDEETVSKCAETRKNGGRIIAVGTTSVRCLESASQAGRLQTFKGDTDIFIYPGYTFKSVDAIITNFHLPESSLMMLVSAFAGRERIMRAYQQAIGNKYRFFSYGDAMFIA